MPSIYQTAAQASSAQHLNMSMQSQSIYLQPARKGGILWWRQPWICWHPTDGLCQSLNLTLNKSVAGMDGYDQCPPTIGMLQGLD